MAFINWDEYVEKTKPLKEDWFEPEEVGEECFPEVSTFKITNSTIECVMIFDDYGDDLLCVKVIVPYQRQDGKVVIDTSNASGLFVDSENHNLYIMADDVAADFDLDDPQAVLDEAVKNFITTYSTEDSGDSFSKEFNCEVILECNNQLERNGKANEQAKVITEVNTTGGCSKRQLRETDGPAPTTFEDIIDKDNWHPYTGTFKINNDTIECVMNLWWGDACLCIKVIVPYTRKYGKVFLDADHIRTFFVDPDNLDFVVTAKTAFKTGGLRYNLSKPQVQNILDVAGYSFFYEYNKPKTEYYSFEKVFGCPVHISFKDEDRYGREDLEEGIFDKEVDLYSVAHTFIDAYGTYKKAAKAVMENQKPYVCKKYMEIAKNKEKDPNKYYYVFTSAYYNTKITDSKAENALQFIERNLKSKHPQGIKRVEATKKDGWEGTPMPGCFAIRCWFSYKNKYTNEEKVEIDTWLYDAYAEKFDSSANQTTAESIDESIPNSLGALDLVDLQRNHKEDYDSIKNSEEMKNIIDDFLDQIGRYSQTKEYDKYGLSKLSADLTTTSNDLQTVINTIVDKYKK